MNHHQLQIQEPPLRIITPPPDHQANARAAATAAAALGDGVHGEGAFREAGFFVPFAPTTRDDDAEYAVHDVRDQGSRALSAAVMDLEQDENETLNAQRNAYHWDKRKKRYVGKGLFTAPGG